MQQLQTILTISVTLMVSAAGLIFGAAEGAPLPALSLPVGILAWFLFDRSAFPRPPQWTQNVLGIAAAAAAIGELMSGNIESRLLAGGHFIVYLAWIFLLQPKSVRSIWWLAALSVLQVAVASVLTSAVWFGASLFLWMFLVFWTMAIFTMHRDVIGTRHGDAPPETEAAYVVNGLRPDERLRLLSGRFTAGVAALAGYGLFVALLFYLLIPRVWMSRMRFFDDSDLAAMRKTGFTDQVRLGDIGEIMGSHEVALEMTLSSHPDGRPWNRLQTMAWLGDAPLFRGRALDHYSHGRWQAPAVRRPPVSPGPPGNQPLVCLEILLRDGGNATLFTTGRTQTCLSPMGGRSIEHRTLTDEYLRSEESSFETFPYTVFADPGSSVPRPQWVGSRPFLWASNEDPTVVRYDEGLLEFPSNLPALAALSREALAGLPPYADAAMKARRIESWLRDSSGFQYTLRQGITDRSIDPVEDFVANRRKGHCEYFASALALMLRAAGIPSRLVTGYKGGDWDDENRLFVVRQRHAHAWVEARINASWLTLDATPALRDFQLGDDEYASRTFLEMVRDVFDNLWSQGMKLSGSQQRTLIYKPLTETFQTVWKKVRNIRSTVSEVANVLRHPEKWFSWQGGLTVFTLLASLALLIRAVVRITRRLVRWRAESLHRGPHRGTVPFFVRYQEIVGREGLRPLPSQTAAEFAETVRGALQQRLIPAGLDAAPRLLSEEFYRIRFGAQELSAEERSRVDQTLDRLDACLNLKDAPQTDDFRPR